MGSSVKGDSKGLGKNTKYHRGVVRYDITIFFVERAVLELIIFIMFTVLHITV